MKLSSILTGSLSLLTIAAVTILTVEELKAQEQAAIERNAVIEVEIADLQYQEQLQCMALNIYHEARSDSTLGQEAVGMVTMNRVILFVISASSLGTVMARMILLVIQLSF